MARSWRRVRNPPAAVKRAFLGVRACELAAIERLDRVFLGDRYVSPGYRVRRENVLICLSTVPTEPSRASWMWTAWSVAGSTRPTPRGSGR